jgi:hypothetical protein
MNREERKRILGEYGVGYEEPRELMQRRALDDSPGTGRPLPRRLRNFQAAADSYVASLGGPLPYMRRLSEIERLTDEHLERLEAAYLRYGRDPARWRTLSRRWDFGVVNDLIERHNRWYPIEARLAMDVRTRDFVTVGGRPYRRPPLDAAWILERFPVG